MFVGQFGWPMLVGLVMGLSSRSMCSSASVAMLFLCMGGRGGKVNEGWEWLGVLGVGEVVVVVVVFVGGRLLFGLGEVVVGEVFWLGVGVVGGWGR